MHLLIGTFLGLIGFGCVLIYVAWLCLGEYRVRFMRNPRLVMSFEVFGYIAEIGGPGYLAALLFTAGSVMVLSGLYASLSLVFHLLS